MTAIMPQTISHRQIRFPRENGASDVIYKNRILAALPAEAVARLAPQMRRVLLHQDDVLQDQNEETQYAYFIEAGLISRVVGGCDGTQVEVAITGREGAVGVLPLLSGCRGAHRLVVQIPGSAFRAPFEAVRREYERNGPLTERLNSYFFALMAQVSQVAFCNRMHTLEERLSRWLLMVRDRIESDELYLTHEFISHMLGVRRSGVTVALGVLHQAGLIETSRGCITILNGDKLRDCACECYEISREQLLAAET